MKGELFMPRECMRCVLLVLGASLAQMSRIPDAPVITEQMLFKMQPRAPKIDHYDWRPPQNVPFYRGLKKYKKRY